ncbi:hypothetical protein [Breoghania sp.]|uniref:hypothetical protein n=1 Tax=Breoghania sp. TaxID=2065378 RepID=UPI00261B6FF4|nr:hypothetical protein [Breoghania sp.]MDJ0932816.1 hypothetical protein [Breoghania sp.]
MANNDFNILIIDIALRDGNGLELLDEIPPDSIMAVAVLTAIDHKYSDPRLDLSIVKSRATSGEVQKQILQVLKERPERYPVAEQS